MYVYSCERGVDTGEAVSRRERAEDVINMRGKRRSYRRERDEWRNVETVGCVTGARNGC